MKTYYNVEIQTTAGNNVRRDLKLIAGRLNLTPKDVDECEEYRAVLFFESDMKPSEVKQHIREILRYEGDRVQYVDIVYRYEYEMTPDRVVIWGDGHEQEYTGKVYFEEDN